MADSKPEDSVYRELDLWLRRLRQVDRLLERSVPTLIEVAKWSVDHDSPSVPLFIAERTMPPPRRYLLVHAIYTSTIQRLHAAERRFSWLDRSKKTLADLDEKLPRVLMASDSADRTSLEFLKYGASDLFGALNPLTSAELFWAFIRAGERFAHSDVGFLAFFGMMWSLSRRYPDNIEAGASLEPSGPSTVTTAKCLTAIDALYDALRGRGELYQRAAGLVQKLDALSGMELSNTVWQFSFHVDILAGTLFELSVYTITPSDFVSAGDDLLAITASLRADSDTKGPWAEARRRITRLLSDLAVDQRSVFHNADEVVHGLLPKVIERLEPGGDHQELRRFCHQLEEHETDEYWADHARAARAAQSLSSRSLRTLEKPFETLAALKATQRASAETLAELMTTLAESNFAVADDVKHFVFESVHWCRRAINDESALASAGNFTDFDPAGLISAIAVAQKWKLISRLEAEDAIEHSLRGALDDGSWSRGQPVYLRERILGAWPHTQDIIWMLAVAVNGEPAITVADDKIFAFVDWLERTARRFTWERGQMKVEGWSSELDRVTGIIDFWNTSVSINALMEIRTLIENRMWDLCKRRFKILPSTRRLSDVAPVDLGAVHERRLHRRLMEMARWSELPEKLNDAHYAIVLHGPPGSSKTALVEGLGTEMWRGVRADARIIRITPADFTHQGEDRLDYEARAIFDLIGHLRGVTILFDEIDDLLRQRVAGEEINFIKLIVPAMLNRLQDLRDAAPRQEICFVVATNFVDKIEPALLRPGRIDAVIPVTYPDVWSRRAILDANGATRRLSALQLDTVIDQTAAWPWSLFNKLAKQIGRKEARIADDDLLAEIDRLRDQVQTSSHYYYDPMRWKKKCNALANEFAHYSFCTSTAAADCRIEVTRLEEWLEKQEVSDEKWITQVFDRQWTLEQRG